MTIYWVRMGSSGSEVAVHAGIASLSRGEKIVCRTTRGLEFGTVLCESTTADPSETARFVKHAEPSDELLWSNLLDLSRDAAHSCQEYLNLHGLDDILLDVEPLFDGRTLFFHFLGEPSATVTERIADLLQVYQQSVAMSPFAKKVEAGCGPNCGTSSKSGCGTKGGCTACVVSHKCRTSAPSP
ncbi:MAG: PSP1 domain-containing protein [Pirellula sp.]|nr:PSP1 domain-containing protein [Pirellula sp.]